MTAFSRYLFPQESSMSVWQRPKYTTSNRLKILNDQWLSENQIHWIREVMICADLRLPSISIWL